MEAIKEILECYFEDRPIRNAYLVVDKGQLAGVGAHSYSSGNATGGSEEAAKARRCVQSRRPGPAVLKDSVGSWTHRRTVRERRLGGTGALGQDHGIVPRPGFRRECQRYIGVQLTVKHFRDR